MLLLQNLLPSPALSIAQFSDIDAFRPAEQITDVRSVPLDVANFYTARATVQLPACQVMALRSFARIVDASYSAPGGLIIIPLEDIEPISANGMSLDARAFLAMRGRVDCQVVEPRATLHALIILSADLPDRGWFDTPDKLRAFAADGNAQASARSVVRDILLTASAEPDLMREPGFALALQENLLVAIDDMFRQSRPAEERSLANGNYCRIVRKIDEYAAFHATSAVYSAELAERCGVSVRTLSTAVTNVRGMSLHRYLRLKQLWAARAQLMRGSNAVTVTSCARANGFHHMGEFASLYRATFHETASRTLARARGIG